MRSMTSWLTRLLFRCVAASAQGQGVVVVGVVVSQTGQNADLAAGYLKGVRLWEAEVNATGGLVGRPVELKVLDDGSDAVRAGELYRQLIQEARADFLIGPYGSAATRAASGEAERERKLMVNGAGPARIVQQGPDRFLFPTGPSRAARRRRRSSRRSGRTPSSRSPRWNTTRASRAEGMSSSSRRSPRSGRPRPALLPPKAMSPVACLARRCDAPARSTPIKCAPRWSICRWKRRSGRIGWARTASSSAS